MLSCSHWGLYRYEPLSEDAVLQFEGPFDYFIVGSGGSFRLRHVRTGII